MRPPPTPDVETIAPAPETSANRNPGFAAAAAATALLAACGGGGSSESGSPPPPLRPRAAATSASAPGITDAEAARFLAQAGFSASSADIATVKANGYAAWLDAQFALPVTDSHFDWMSAHGFAVVDHRNDFGGADNTLWRKLLSAPDALRQRVVLALSEIFVISMSGLPTPWRGFAIAAYVDMLEQRSFGTYRELLEAVTLSCGMGVYLAMRGNRREDPKTGRQPDENYAREVMQLFSIGLYQLNADGTLQRDGSGNPIETYSQANVTDLARVFTGWDFDGYSGTDPGFMKKPMAHIAARFSSGPKRVLDVDIPASADGPAALKIALDTLAAHPNVGPFIGRQLIQRLVASNPSAAFVARVAAVWADNGAGVRGDLKAVLKAILLDSEARTVSIDPGSGKLREPLQRFIQWGRTFNVASGNGAWAIGNTSDAGRQLGQSPLRSPSVFNFFRPGYVPPNSQLGTRGVTAPEFQLCNESTVAGYLNYLQKAIADGVADVKPSYTAELALAADAPGLVAHLALRLGGGGISTATQATIATAVATVSAGTDAGKLNRVQAAILMLMACPEYQVQK